MRNTRVLFALLAAGLGLAVSVASAAAAPATTVVMSGLDNPRGLTFGQKDALYVAEAGHGGDTPCGLGGPEGTFYGQTGAVSRLLRGHQERIATGLPSTAEEGGVGATTMSAS